MEVRFTLTMEDAVVEGQKIDRVIIDWIDETSYDSLLEISHDWLTTRESLAGKMHGLENVREMSLAMEAT
nr:hypothetical protein [candidate division Zixibacteria bacterium]